MTEKSLYQRILQSVRDGELGPEFRLDPEPADDSIVFPDGAYDGMIRYHLGHSKLDAAGTKLAARALKAADVPDSEQADALFFELGRECRAIAVVDDFQGYLFKNARKYSGNNLHAAAIHIVLMSRNTESVKYAVEMLEMFSHADEDTKQVIRTLGLSDEFTVFAGWAMQKWENGNDEVFRLAKKVHGWGRIHLVDLIVPDTEEIREWLLFEGTKNNIDPGYSALTVWNKANVAEKLEQVLSYEQFTAISDILLKLVEEGPQSGLSAMENPELQLKRFLRQAERFDLSVYDYETLLTVAERAEAEPFPEIAERARAFLDGDACREKVTEAVKRGEALSLAETLGIPFAEDLYRLMKQDFAEHFEDCGYLLHSEGYAEKTIELFEKNIDLALIADGAGENADPQAVAESCDRLVDVLYALGDLPLTGKKLVIAALNARTPQVRFSGMNTLEQWTAERQMPLRELSPELYFEIKKLRPRETEEILMDQEDRLLNGIFETGEDMGDD